MQIRRAERGDVSGIDRLLAEVNRIHHEGRPDLFDLGRKYTDDQIAEMLGDDSRPIFVAVDEGGEVLGYAFCQHQQIIGDTIRTPVKTLYIDDLCVDEATRGRGVGRSLFDHVLAYAREAGCHDVTLNVWELNPGARAFYERMGMRPLKTCMETLL
ncbi:GNAT family N-acetyltransferase [Olsenella sp. YH-ols2223]|uniref:GNAT family N-acetyltransferase n=1 Tax=Olsenella absiana TaxID=3115222 RepID=A0ABU7R731_9ACTN